MAFNSSIFLVWFLPVFLVLYLLLRQKARNAYLLVVSVLIYAWAEPRFVLVLLATTCLDFYLVRFMSQCKTQRTKKVMLAFSISMNVSLLLYFKYANFFIDNLNSLFHLLGMQDLKALAIILPLGISFYTFETITYVVDVYKGEQVPQKKLSNYLLYIFLFPKMIAGPIIRYREISDQITNRSVNENANHRLNGFYRFCIGLAKKVLIANQLAMYGVDKLFYMDADTLSGASAWIALLGYTMQIYYDFSAYSDMAIGLGKMIGFRLPENFDSPYISKNITEFWRRWHITLGAWMKNYLYIPLGGNKLGSKRMYLNLWIVFLISGLWHKGSWSFILWGAYHGALLVLDRRWMLQATQKLPALLKVITTFLLVMLGNILFRTEDLTKALKFLKALCFQNSVELTEVRKEFWLPLLLAILFSFANAFSLGKKMQNYFYGDQTQTSRHVFLTVLAIVLFVLSLSFNTRVGWEPFIYFRF